MPPKVELEQVKGFSLYALKAVLNGRGDELARTCQDEPALRLGCAQAQAEDAKDYSGTQADTNRCILAAT